MHLKHCLVPTSNHLQNYLVQKPYNFEINQKVAFRPLQTVYKHKNNQFDF